MISLLKKLFGGGAQVDLKSMVHAGAQIIDVRTRSEFNAGHIPGSVNIPLDELDRHLPKIKRDKPVITCCASGVRSSAAKNFLKSKGFTEVHNGGGWRRLQGRIT